MTIYVRRISQRRVEEYNLFTFIMDTFNGYPCSGFTDIDALKAYLKNYYNKKLDDANLIQEHVFVNEDKVWLFVVDYDKQEVYSLHLEFNLDVALMKA